MQKQDSRSWLVTMLKHNLDHADDRMNQFSFDCGDTSVKTSFEVCIFTVDFQYIIRFVMYVALAAKF